ncbi:serpin family protein [Nocardioides sp. ChNu-153]|uniref:serpin family protein n=1 Tax=unclassified Nocardioides TaxID=2615069 RepID=UPI002404DAD5|nr:MULTISPECIES: serpin family protein [unclassified Nocardioides]MDF9714927.1 serpin family protein [Nocardioides sp. ChNu-99]MDN7122476.1 serpin family protein [Nocardioides sp. ChNu-153]
MELTRRDTLRLAGLLALLAGTPALAACGDGSSPAGGVDLAAADVPGAEVDPALAAVGAASAHAVGAALVAHAAEAGLEVDGRLRNAVVSPCSVAVALAMTLAGARGATAAEMEAVLGGDAEGLGDGFNALTAHVEGLAGRVTLADGGAAEVVLAVANRVFGQAGLRWEEAFLEALATSYGAGLQLADFAADPEAGRVAVNGWVAEQTEERIPELVPAGVISDATRLVLVNAVYFHAPWATAFEVAATEDGVFTTGAGEQVTVPLMSSRSVADGYGVADGVQVARLPYADGRLAMTVMLPAAGEEAELVERLAGGGLPGLLDAVEPVTDVQVVLPRWEMRTQARLEEALSAAGMPTAFGPGADFSGMSVELALVIGAVVHEGWIEVTEAGTEAAAATALVMDGVSAFVPPSLTLDRPFAYCIHDVAHGTPLFVGWVDDPSQRPD